PVPTTHHEAQQMLDMVLMWVSQQERRTPEERLTVDDLTLTVTLDGKRFPDADPTAFQLFRAIYQGGGRPVSSSELMELPGLRGKNIPREVNKLPRALRDPVKGNRGKGYWIQLPPARRTRR